MRTAALVLAMAACHGGGTKTTTDPTGPANIAPSHTPSGPPPSVAWDAENGGWKLTGLPAVARAGEVTVVPVDENAMATAERNPVLDLEVRDRDDKKLQTVKVTGVGGFVEPAQAPAREKERDRQVGEANKQLETLHGVHDLQPMGALQNVVSQDDGSTHMASGDNLDVEWRDYHLRVFRHNDTRKPLVDKNGVSWAAPVQKAGPDSCSNPDFLRAVYHAPGVNTVVVRIGYHGTDSCWEPSDTFHVVTWP